MYAQQPFHMCPSDRGNHGLSNTRSGSAAAGDCEMYGNIVTVAVCKYVHTWSLLLDTQLGDGADGYQADSWYPPSSSSSSSSKPKPKLNMALFFCG